jgi:hypothetical protein
VWITANSFWMCSEFIGIDNQILFRSTTIKQLAMIPFLTGVLILGYYYLWYHPKHSHKNK